MKFYSLENAPLRKDDVVFKQTPVNAGVFAFLFLGLSALFILMARHVVGGTFGMPPLMAWVFALFLGLIGLFTLSQFRAALKPSDWLLRVNSFGVLIKYRSYLNCKLPAGDAQIVELDFSEIAWVRRANERRTSFSPGDSGGQSHASQNFEYLNLKLAIDPSPLAENLRAELDRESAASSHWIDNPVELLSDGIISIQWRAGSNKAIYIVPKLDRAIELLGRRVATEGAANSNSDLTTANGAEDLKEKARKLAISGDKFAACELVKKELRCSTAEAMRFIDQAQTGS